MLDKVRALPLPMWLVQILLPVLASLLISGMVSNNKQIKTTTTDVAVVATKVEALAKTVDTMQSQTNRIEAKLDKILMLRMK